jgi:hypothetical protein
LYDNYGQAPGAEDPYGRNSREPAPPQHPRYAAEPVQESYERTLGARIARDAAPSRFYLPEEQQQTQGYAQQARIPAGHEQLYDPSQFEPHPLDEPVPLQPGSNPAYDGHHADSTPYWGEETAGLDERYLGALPAERHQGRDELDADFFSDEDEFEHDEADVPPRKSRKKLIAAVLAGAVTIGGGSAYVYKTVVDGGTPGGAPVIRADAGSAKATPSDPGGRQFAGGEKTIYDRLTPDGPVSGAAAERAPLPAADRSSASAAGDRPPAPSSAGTTLEDRIEEALRKATRAEGEARPAATRAGPDQPIVVRSETYRPDGTRVEAAAQAAGGQRGVMDTANLPPPFGSAPTATPSAVATSPSSVTSGIVTTRQVASVAAPPPAPAPEPARPVVETRTVAAAAPIAAAPAPSRPAAAAPQAPVRTAAIPPAATAGGHFVQLRASQDERRALAEINELNDKFGVVLGGVSISSRAVDLGEKGVWFRLLAGPLPSKDSATELCNKLKGAGLPSCLVRSE